MAIITIAKGQVVGCREKAHSLIVTQFVGAMCCIGVQQTASHLTTSQSSIRTMATQMFTRSRTSEAVICEAATLLHVDSKCGIGKRKL
jgi:hypothetical protein